MIFDGARAHPALRRRVFTGGRTLSRLPPPGLHDANGTHDGRLVAGEIDEDSSTIPSDLLARGEADPDHRVGDRLHGDGAQQLHLAAQGRPSWTTCISRGVPGPRSPACPAGAARYPDARRAPARAGKRSTYAASAQDGGWLEVCAEIDVSTIISPPGSARPQSRSSAGCGSRRWVSRKRA